MSADLALSTAPRVYVVDDDEAVRTALQLTLELDGFQVVTDPSGEALLSRGLPEADACLVIDERLPGLSGLETVLELRRRNVRLPAILITSHPKAAFRQAAAAASCPIVEKPLIGEALRQAISASLK